MSLITGEPFEPIETTTPGERQGVPLRWWEMVPISTLFLAMIIFDLLSGR